MEKRTPHCKLAIVKALATEGKIQATTSALSGAATLGLSFDDLIGVVLTLTPKDFYKSMTTYTNHRIWQDVYRPRTSAGDVYLKLTVTEEVIVISFKEL